jgi:hypothetical protein
MGLRETYLLDLLDNLINPATEDTLQEILERLVALFPSETIFQYNTANTVAGSALSTIVTYTNSTGDDIWLDGFIAQGTVDAEYFLYINNVAKVNYRTSEQDRTAKVYFPRLVKIPNGTIVEVKVEHAYTFTADFSATIIGSKFD